MYLRKSSELKGKRSPRCNKALKHLKVRGVNFSEMLVIVAPEHLGVNVQNLRAVNSAVSGMGELT